MLRTPTHSPPDSPARRQNRNYDRPPRTRRIAFLLLLPAALFVAAGVLSLIMPFSLTNFAETMPEHPDVSLRTRRYLAPNGGVGRVAAVVNALIPTLTTYGRHWRLVAPSPSAGLQAAHDENGDANPREIVAEVPVLFFTDDLRVKIKPGARNSEALVDVRSASRVGKSDLGENRRHILQLLSALDAKLVP